MRAYFNQRESGAIEGEKMIEILIPMVIFGFFAEYIDGALAMAYGVTSSSFILTLGVAPAITSASLHLGLNINVGSANYG